MSNKCVKRVELHDIMKYRFLSTPRFSPCGGKIAFKVHQGDLENNRYISCLWVYDIASGASTQLTTSGADGAYCWSEDGREIFFVSDRAAQPAEPKPCCHAPKMTRLFRVPVCGGEARYVASVPRSVTEIWALPNEHFLVKNVDLRKQERAEDADYLIFEQIPFNSNGKGYTEQRRTRLSIFFPTDEKLTDISPETTDVAKVRLTDDKKHLYYTGVDYTDVMPLVRGVWYADLTNATQQTFVCQCEGARWECAAPFGDGVLMIGSYMKEHGLNENRQFFIKHGDEIRNITPELDRSLHNSVGSDCRYGIGDVGEGFTVDGSKAWFVKTDGFRSVLCTVDAHGTISEHSGCLSAVDDYDIHDGKAAVVGLRGLALQELYIIENDKARCVTSFNTEILEGTELSEPKHVRLDNGTPEGLDCWYMKPLGYEAGKKYPTILDIHGGPKTAFGDVFFHEMQYWAAEGYAILFCNPRGSDGKGNSFSNIRGKYGTVDYEDIMQFVDWAVANLSFVDADRLGVTGGSYGGYMTNWIVGHTDRFRAAATQRSICNWTSKLGMSDIGYYFVPDQNYGEIGEDVTALWDRSPLKYADNFKTPTLIIHSDEDFRCELGQGLQMFTALKLRKVPTRMCVFKGENHELSRSGRPKPRLARLEEITAWFKKLL